MLPEGIPKLDWQSGETSMAWDGAMNCWVTWGSLDMLSFYLDFRISGFLWFPQTGLPPVMINFYGTFHCKPSNVFGVSPRKAHFWDEPGWTCAPSWGVFCARLQHFCAGLAAFWPQAQTGPIGPTGSKFRLRTAKSEQKSDIVLFSIWGWLWRVALSI